MTSGVQGFVVLATILTATACSASQSGNGSFASSAGVLGCADLVAWGTVVAAEPVDGRLQVRLEVVEWVVPADGSDTVVFLADDPAKEIGAPAWDSQDEVLVIVSPASPAARYSAVEGQRAVTQWREEGSPRLSDEQCEGA